MGCARGCDLEVTLTLDFEPSPARPGAAVIWWVISISRSRGDTSPANKMLSVGVNSSSYT